MFDCQNFAMVTIALVMIVVLIYLTILVTTANCKCRNNKSSVSAAVRNGHEEGDQYNLITTDENEHHVTRFHEDDDDYEQHSPNMYEDEDGSDDNFSAQGDDYNVKTNEIKPNSSKAKPPQSQKYNATAEKSSSNNNDDVDQPSVVKI